MNKEKIIDKFNMQPHPEGGWYKELWQSPKTVGERHLSSHIYYLLEKDEVSKWHRLTSDEIWLFHSGDYLTLTLGGKGKTPIPTQEVEIGKDLFHLLIPANTWQRATAKLGDSLVSCVVSPGYNDEDYEMI
ncbi:MAG: cupin domain-containing protein [Clostridiales bacterium]